MLGSLLRWWHRLLTFAQTSASDSVLTAVTAARTRYLRRLAQSSADPPDLGPLDPAHPGTDPRPDANPQKATVAPILYTTSQTHSVGVKAGLILNLPVRALPVYAKDNYALRGETLRRALEEDEQAGRGVCALGTCAFLRSVHVAGAYPGLC